MAATFNVAVTSTNPNVTLEKVNNSIANFYYSSPTFKIFYNYMATKPGENFGVAIVVGEPTVPGSFFYTRNNWDANNGPWPYGDNKYAIQLDTNQFNGDSFDSSGVRNSFERTLGHEFTHFIDEFIEYPGAEDGQDLEDRAVRIENRMMNEAFGEDPNARDGFNDILNGYTGIVEFRNVSPNMLPDFPLAPEGKAGWIETVVDWFVDTFNIVSPLVLDLNNSNSIDLISTEISNAYFDIDGDGFAEHTGWVGPTDGLLAYDRNEDGVISDITELFGSAQEEGFGYLAELDSNADGKIDSSDESWSDLQVWVDTNGNGFSEEEELYTLGDYNIASINFANVRVDQTVNGNFITNEGTFTYENNSIGKIVDAWFSYDNANSSYNEDYVLDIYALLLPTARGYGDIPSLHVAMSIDNSSGGLLDNVLSFIQQDPIEIFSSATLKADMKEILSKWAGVEGVSPTSRGSYVDAHDLIFLEKLTGADFLQGGWSSRPGYVASKEVNKTFDEALYNIFARIVMQTEASSLFEDNITYNIYTDSFNGVGGLNTSFLADLTAEAITLPDAITLWQNVVRVIVSVKGESNITPEDIADLDTAISASDASLDYQAVLNSWYTDVSSGNEIDGTNGDDTLTGTNLDDTIEGANGNDVLNGRDGGDILYGQNGDDTLNGDEGADSLFGGAGNDTYIYNLGDGDDTIYEHSYAELGDKIVFGAGITLDDLSFVRLSNTDLQIVIDAVGGQGQIVIEKQFNGGSANGSVEILQFSDNSTFDLTGLNLTLIGSDLGETLEGARQSTGGNDIIYGLGGNDRINGLAGVDEIHGGDGDDTIYGGDNTSAYGDELDSNTLHGDAGKDYLGGAYGADYLYGGRAPLYPA